MPYFATSQEWLEQSKLLLEARPATTRIVTKYSIDAVKPRSKESQDTAAAKPPRGCLVIKTYDPVSGVSLKYRTTKAAEVSRLICTSLGRLGRGMAAMPDVPEEPMPDAAAAADAQAGDATEKAATGSAPQTQQQSGGGKKKKKGKK